MKHKHPAIDLIKLRQSWTENDWRNFLKRCEKAQDLNKLKATMYGICRGMDILSKSALNDDLACLWFADLVRSIEVTAKRIYRKRHPSIFDIDPKSSLASADHKTVKQEFANKKRRDVEFQKFLKDARF